MKKSTILFINCAIIMIVSIGLIKSTTSFVFVFAIGLSFGSILSIAVKLRQKGE